VAPVLAAHTSINPAQLEDMTVLQIVDHYQYLISQER